MLKRLAISVFLICGLTEPMMAAELDLSDPAQAMETWVRLKGDTAGRVTYEWVTGTVYGLPADDMSRVLFRMESVTVRQTRKEEGGYVERNFACRLYKDAETGDYIGKWDNPYTTKTVDLDPKCSDGLATRLSAAGMELLADIEFQSSALNRPMSLELIEAGDHVVIRRDAHSHYTRSNGEERQETSFDTFKLKTEDLNNPELTALFPAYSWVSNTYWMSIFDMGNTPGHMIWAINGRKYMSAEDLPADFRAAVERFSPGAWEREIDWPK